MKKHIPNAITCLNLLAGTLGIVFCFNGLLLMAGLAIFAAAIFDFFDGFAARWLQVSSSIGKELDSLADMVSFGLLPGFIMMKLIYNGPMEGILFYLSLIALLIPLFSALRLAKFNVDTRQSESFIGLPTPANAMLIASLPFILATGPQPIALWVQNLGFKLLLPPIMSFLLVAELPLLALKFKDFSWANNRFRWILILLSVVLLIGLQFAALPFIIVLYILLSLLEKWWR